MNYNRYKQSNFKSKFNFGFKENLIIANVLIFLITLVFPIIVQYGGVYSPMSENFSVYQLFTHQYLHGGFTHLFFNMIGLYFLWNGISSYMTDKRIFLFYTICGVVSSLGHYLVSYLISGETNGISIGASGAIYGLFAANYIYNKSQTILLFFIIPVKMSVLFPLLMIYELGSGLFMSCDGIGHLSHFFGGLAGLALIKLIKK